MLNTNPKELIKLINSSEAERDLKLEAIDRRQKVAMGALGEAGNEIHPENLGFSLYSMLLPSVATSSPVLEGTSSGGYLERLQAVAVTQAATKVLKSTRSEREFEPCFWDYFFKTHCAGFVESGKALMADLTQDERKTMRGRLFADDPAESASDDETSPVADETPRPMAPARWPRFKRLDVRRCGWDMAMGSQAQARFTFHSVTVDYQSLLKRAQEHADDWRPENVAQVSDTKRPGLNRSSSEIRYVDYYVVYVPGDTLTNQQPTPENPGVIYTLSHDGLEIRRPYYYVGHPDGPHVFGGQYRTGCDSGFITLLGANEDTLALTEAVAASMYKRIRDYKEVHVYDSASKKTVQNVAKAGHGEFVAVPGLRDGGGVLDTVQTNALTPAEVNGSALLQQAAARNLSIDDALQGNANGNATATEASIAASSVQTRLEYLRTRWTAYVREIGERVCYDIAHNSDMAIRLDEGARESVLRQQLAPLAQQGILSPMGLEAVIEDQRRVPMLFQGGDFVDSEGHLDWHSLEIDVQPMSMEGATGSAAVARQAQWNSSVAQLGMLMVQQPHIRWVERLRATGRAMGMTDAEMLADVDRAEEVAQMTLAQGTNDPVTIPNQDSPDRPTPRAQQMQMTDAA